MSQSSQQKPQTSTVSPLNIFLNNKLALGVSAVFIVVWSALLRDKFLNFGYYDWDLALYTNAMWALTQGSLSGSLWGTNFLTNHAEYIAFILTPIYKVFPSALTLIFLKIISVAVAGFFIYLIAKSVLGWIPGILILIAYYIFPANSYMLLFEFHFESLAIAFIVMAYYFHWSKPQYPAFFISAFLAVICKENIPFVIAMMGVAILLGKEPRRAKFGWTAIGIGVFIGWLGFFVLTPWFRSMAHMETLHNPYIGMFVPAVSESGTIISNGVHLIANMLSRIFSSQNFAYFTNVLLPFSFFVIFSPKILWPAAPLIAQALLASTVTLKSIEHHYAATLVPLLFIGTIQGIAWQQDFLKKNHKKLFKPLLLCLFLALIFAQAFEHFPELRTRTHLWKNPLKTQELNMIQEIPNNKSILASFKYLPHLANRDQIYPIRNLWRNQNPLNLSAPYVAPDTDLLFLDPNDSWSPLASNHVNPKRIQGVSRLTEYYFKYPWGVHAGLGDTILLKQVRSQMTRKGVNQAVLKQQTPFESQSTLPVSEQWVLDEALILHGTAMAIDQLPGNTDKSLRLTLDWQNIEPTNKIYFSRIIITNKNNTSAYWFDHRIGYHFYPALLWDRGEYVRENLWLPLSELEPDEYTISIRVFDAKDKTWAIWTSADNSQALEEISLNMFYDINPLQIP